MIKLLEKDSFSLYLSHRDGYESKESAKRKLFSEARRDYLSLDDDAEIIKLPSGAPAYADDSCRVSYSDKADLMVVALSDRPVGVDVEKLFPRDYRGVARKFFGRDDMTLVEFYEAWTAAEALAKRDGEGIIPYRVRDGRLTTIEYDDYLVTVAE